MKTVQLIEIQVCWMGTILPQIIFPSFTVLLRHHLLIMVPTRFTRINLCLYPYLTSISFYLWHSYSLPSDCLWSKTVNQIQTTLPQYYLPFFILVPAFLPVHLRKELFPKGTDIDSRSSLVGFFFETVVLAKPHEFILCCINNTDIFVLFWKQLWMILA